LLFVRQERSWVGQLQRSYLSNLAVVITQTVSIIYHKLNKVKTEEGWGFSTMGKSKHYSYAIKS